MNPLLVPLDATGAIIVIVVIVIILVALVAAGVGMYNSLVQLRNKVQESWNQVDVELQRRYDLIPNLVETVKGSAGFERNTLESVIQLRNQAVAMNDHGLPTPERAQVEDQLTQAVRNFMVTVEAYPDLKSNQNFIELQRALTETEDRIAAGRRFFNANVRAYNTKCESIPTNIIASMGKFEKANYFEVRDTEVRQSQRIDFGPMSEVGPSPSQQRAQQGGGAPGVPSYQQAYPPAQPTPEGQQGPWGQQGGQTAQQRSEALGATEPAPELTQGQQPQTYAQAPQQQPYQQGQPAPVERPNDPGQQR